MSLKLVMAKADLREPREVPNLRLNAHAAMLAVTAFCHHQQFYQLGERSWESLPGEEKQLWIDEQAEWLRDREPTKCLMGCGRYVRPGETYCDDPICTIQAENDHV